MTANASPAVLAPVDVAAGFSDQSTASPEEKARRVLANMAARYSPLFFDDGFPRDVLHTDALAAKRVFEQLAADLAAAREDVARLRAELSQRGDYVNDTLRQRAEAAEADAARWVAWCERHPISTYRALTGDAIDGAPYQPDKINAAMDEAIAAGTYTATAARAAKDTP